jgi:hypothetical protein
MESVISNGNELGLSEHFPNACISQVVCLRCINIHDKDFTCDHCGIREKIFMERCFQINCRGNCLLSDFFEYIFGLISKSFKVIMISHNGGFYDSHFLLKFILNNTHIFHEIPQLVTKGTKIYSIKTKHFKIIDSLNFFGTSLKCLPKMFGISEEKGYFPYLFNTNEKLSYVGSWPDKKYFMPQGMKTDEKLAFEEWYNEISNSSEIYNHRESLIKYCSLDVTILRKACVNFYSYFREHFGFNIFETSLTIAASCNKIFRSKFMQKDSIGIIPLNGYRFVDNQSLIALKWLYTQEFIHGFSIEHAGNGREKKIGNYRVDGYRKDSVTNTETVYEFLGCYWHSCPKCYPHIAENSDEKLLFISRRENTESRLNFLRSQVDTVITIWECEFKHNLAEDQELSRIASRDPYTRISPLNPRDAFFGGRTSTIVKYHKVEQGEKIRYYDVCSLYPYVNKNFKVPLGHPRILLGEEARSINIASFEGILKARVLPPSNLYHPVLPFKMHQKLMFFLCYTCALEKTNECNHTEQDRSFVGTWVVDEVRMALEKGYQILEIFEGWEYEVQTGVFAQYVNTFLKIKQEASGYPSWCTSDTLKTEYVRNYKAKEGIELDPLKIEKNSGRRSSAKLCLNSFWGKFGENPAHKSKYEIVIDSKRYFELIMCPTILITKVVIINETTLLVCYENSEDACENLNTVNVGVAAYTTCGARLKLYSYLDLMGPRIIYMDTDSVFFTEKPGEPTLPLGDYLGDLTDELSDFGQGAYISEFVSGGPKNYAFEVTIPQTNSKKYVIKAKGFTLNHQNLGIVNFHSMRDMVLSSDSDELGDNNFLVTKTDKIIRRGMGNLFSKSEDKVYQLHYTKRKEIDNFRSVPWGYKL